MKRIKLLYCIILGQYQEQFKSINHCVELKQTVNRIVKLSQIDYLTPSNSSDLKKVHLN